MPKKIDFTGQRFGRLTVISKTNKRSRGSIVWLCQCNCPLESFCEVTTYHLKTKHVRSCGCLAKEVRQKNGRLYPQRMRPKGVSRRKYTTDRLTNSYVKELLCNQFNIKCTDTTSEMIGIKREQLKTYRLMKRIKKEYNL